MNQYVRILLLFIAGALSLHTLQAQSAKKLHFDAILVDTHNDVLHATNNALNMEDDLRGKTHSDLDRFSKGGVDVQFFSVWCGEDFGQGTAFRFANSQIDSLEAVVRQNPDKVALVTDLSGMKEALEANKLAAFIGVEGGHMIEDKLEYLDSLYARGTRYLSLTWNNSTSWASSAMDETENPEALQHKGLNELGKDIVKRMNALGMMVDVSHSGEQTFWDVIETSRKPVIASHSSVYAICPHFRNLKDEQIKAMAENGGVIQLNFFSGFLDPLFDRKQRAFNEQFGTQIDSLRARGMNRFEAKNTIFEQHPEAAEALRPPLSLLLDHLDHIVDLVGVDYVGFGSDFDGITSSPQQLDGVEDYPVITEALLERGYDEEAIRKMLGGNMLRVLAAQE